MLKDSKGNSRLSRAPLDPFLVSVFGWRQFCGLSEHDSSGSASELEGISWLDEEYAKSLSSISAYFWVEEDIRSGMCRGGVPKAKA